MKGTEIYFSDIAYVKVNVIALQKNLHNSYEENNVSELHVKPDHFELMEVSTILIIISNEKSTFRYVFRFYSLIPDSNGDRRYLTMLKGGASPSP